LAAQRAKRLFPGRSRREPAARLGSETRRHESRSILGGARTPFGRRKLVGHERHEIAHDLGARGARAGTEARHDQRRRALRRGEGRVRRRRSFVRTCGQGSNLPLQAGTTGCRAI